MRVIRFLFLIFLLPVFAVAQERHYSTTDKEAIKYFAIANQSLDDHLYEDAVVQLQKALAEDAKFIEANALLADVYRLLHQHKKAAEQYVRTLSLNPNYSPLAYLKVGDEEIDDAQYRSE